MRAVFRAQRRRRGLLLLDILATEPAIKAHVLTDGFAVVKLKVLGSMANLVIDDGGKHGDKPRIVFLKHIDTTNCPESPVSKRNPEGEWRFYMTNTGDGMTMLMLPSEY